MSVRSRYLAALWFLFAGVVSPQAIASDDLTFRTVNGSGGVPLNVVEAGKRDNPGILFIHGNGQSYLSWHEQLHSGLADDFHLVAFDLRGHGNSGKPWDVAAYNQACIWAKDVSAVIRETGLVNPLVVAWSRGGLIAMHYVACEGVENISGLAMVASRGRLVEVPLPSEDNPARVSQVQLEDQDIALNLAGAETFADLMTAQPISDEWSDISKAMNIMAPPYARRAMRSPVMGPNGNAVTSYARLIDAITVPFLVILGEDDPLRDSSQLAAAFLAALPQTEVVMYPGVGHSPFLEVPDEFNATLRSFAQSVSKLN